VLDHCAALDAVLHAGRHGETYNVGGACEMPNLEIVRLICGVLDKLQPRADARSYAEQIRFVADRPGHDRRYAIDAGKISAELGWRPQVKFEVGICETVQWYLDHESWVNAVMNENFEAWVAVNYSRRTTTS
jgi:dTDP-glucose 4,6-dehydratase